MFELCIILFQLFLLVAPPSKVFVSSPVFVLGTHTLTCAITLSSSLSSYLHLVVEWIGPDGNKILAGTPPTGINKTYSSELILYNLTASDAGSTYTCRTKLNSSDSFHLSSLSVNHSVTLTDKGI